VNLNQIVGPIISAVNPMLTVGIRVSVGQGDTLPDGTRPPLYAAPGAFTGAIAGQILTVTAQAAGKLQAGQTLAGGAILAGTYILGQIDGDDGGIGTYTVSRAQDAASLAISTVFQTIGQLQPMSSRDLEQLDGINLGGNKMSLYVNGDINGVVRYRFKGGDLVDLPDGSVWLVSQQIEGWNMTAGWTKAALTLQDGS
jgi:hypothetical protein